MGTKNNPGRYDCYATAAPDEPMFVLLGRDPLAPFLVELWAQARALNGEDPEKVAEASRLAAAMVEYLVKLGKKPIKLVFEQRIVTHEATTEELNAGREP